MADQDTRTWTDEQLVAAVASATCWKAVARSLGLVQSSTPRIRRHALRLGLDTSHFTGRRRWSTAELRGALTEATSWAELMSLLGIGDTPEGRLRVKGHAVRMGLDLSGVERSPTTAPRDVYRACPNTAYLRRAAESIALTWFTLRGIKVAIPSEPSEYDLLVTFSDGIKRVQVKSTTCRTKNGTWQVIVGRRPYSLEKAAAIAPYDPDTVDYFFVIDGDAALYLLPSCIVAGRTRIYVRAYTAYRVGDASSLVLDAS